MNWIAQILQEPAILAIEYSPSAGSTIGIRGTGVASLLQEKHWQFIEIEGNFDVVVGINQPDGGTKLTIHRILTRMIELGLSDHGNSFDMVWENPHVFNHAPWFSKFLTGSAILSATIADGLTKEETIRLARLKRKDMLSKDEMNWMKLAEERSRAFMAEYMNKRKERINGNTWTGW